MEFMLDNKIHRLNFGEFSMKQARFVRNIYQMSDDEIIALSSGSFNLWAAITYKAGQRESVALPKDEYYFALLKHVEVSGEVPRDVLWGAICWVYDNSGLQPDFEFCRAISRFVFTELQYGSYDIRKKLHNGLLHIYYGFIAENYYRGERVTEGPIVTRFGAAIKKNGLWNMFATNDLDFATQGPRGNGGAIAAEIKQRGILVPKAIAQVYGVSEATPAEIFGRRNFQPMYDVEAKVLVGYDSFCDKECAYL